MLDHGKDKHENICTDVLDILMVKLGHLMLKSVEKLGCCRFLRICILSDNSLTKIDALIECTHLVKLDLKRNQITQLPDSHFWSHLRELQLLYLHDNNISAWKDTAGLSTCPSLAALTLYSTPLSLWGNYRHSLVNSISSLKALDNCVISDEEIVENWSLPLKYKALTPHFRVNLYPATQESFSAEMKTIRKIVARINAIQARYCPTLIIQRWVRGYLTRERHGKWCRGSRKQLSPIPSELTSSEAPAVSPEPLDRSLMEESRVDEFAQKMEDREGKCKRLDLNLNERVQTGYSEEMENVTCCQGLHPLCNTPRDRTVATSCRIKSNKTTYDMKTETKVFYNDDTAKKDLPHFVARAPTHQAEPIGEMLISRREGGRSVREAIGRLRGQRASDPRALPPRRPPRVTAEERLIARCCDCISLGPFRAIERAHRERELVALQRAREEQVLQAKARQEEARLRRESFLEARRGASLLQEERDQVEMEAARQRLKARRDVEIKQAQQRHDRFLEEKKRRSVEQELVRSFSRQNLSLVKAMARHSMHQRMTDTLQQRRQQLQSYKDKTTSPKQLPQDNLKDRRQIMQVEATDSKTSREDDPSQKHQYQLLKAKARAWSIKDIHSNIKTVQPAAMTLSTKQISVSPDHSQE